MIDDEIQDLIKRRTEALGKFLEENAELFTLTEAELDGDSIVGPIMVTGALLVMRSRDFGDDTEAAVTVRWPLTLGPSERIGILRVAESREFG